MPSSSVQEFMAARAFLYPAATYVDLIKFVVNKHEFMQDVPNGAATATAAK